MHRSSDSFMFLQCPCVDLQMLWRIYGLYMYSHYFYVFYHAILHPDTLCRIPGIPRCICTYDCRYNLFQTDPGFNLPYKQNISLPYKLARTLQTLLGSQYKHYALKNETLISSCIACLPTLKRQEWIFCGLVLLVECYKSHIIKHLIIQFNDR